MTKVQSVTLLGAVLGAACLGGALGQAALVPNARAWQFTSISTNGLSTGARLADPANIFQNFGDAITTSFAIDGSTLYVPSAGSTGQTAAIPGGTQVMTLTGKNFNSASKIFVGTLNAGNTNRPTACVEDTTFGGVTMANSADTTSRTFLFPGGNGALAAPATKGWDDQSLELEEIRGWHPRPICLQETATNTIKWTGLWLQVHWDCDEPSVNANADRLCSNFKPVLGPYIPLSDYTKAALKSRTTCCRAKNGLGAGRCINPNEASCCGAGAVRPGSKCCSASTEATDGLTSQSEVMVGAAANCPCRSENEVTINGVATNLDCAGPTGDRTTATATSCCLPDKDLYTSFQDTANNNNYISGLWGSCLSSTSTKSKCCSTGQVYGPTEVCCEVNGVQDLNANANPCACATDADCGSTGGSCCTGSAPQGVRTAPLNCNRFINFPASIPASIYGADNAVTPFPADVAAACGRCYDSSFQTCCNGELCSSKYEKCCNTACCNRHTQTCEEGHVTASGSWRFRHEDKQCSTIEHLSPFRAFFVFVLPTALLFSFLGALAIVIVFANRASNRSYSFIESAMVFAAAAAAIFALPLFFSPAFKYAVVICITALVAIVAAAARIRLVNVGLVILTAIALWYVFDPVPANHWFSATSFNRVARAGVVGVSSARPRTDELTNGLFFTLRHLAYGNNAAVNFCTEFYDGYFALDGNLRDTVRFDNAAVTTFGYCERGFVAVALVAAAISVLALIILFVAAILALVLRFRKEEEIVPLA